MAAPPISDIAHIIQLSVAPVFLLVAVGSLLNVITGRLARIIDRARALEIDAETADEKRRAFDIAELNVLSQRMRLCQWAITMCTVSAVLVCVTVSVLFVSSIATMDFTVPVALLFIAVMAAMTAGVSLFFIEVSISTRVVRVREEYLLARGKRARPKPGDHL